MPSIYAVIFVDPKDRGFEKVATDTGNLLIGRGYNSLFMSNEFPVSETIVANPDLHVRVYQSHVELESLTAFEETPSAPQSDAEELRERVQDADRALRRVFELVDGTQMQCGLEDALDPWDAFAQQFETGPEEA